MSAKFSPKVVTANHLLDGDVIYLADDMSWTLALNNAAVFVDEEAANAALALATSQPEIAVGAYLADVANNDDGPQPNHFREEFRRTGPSNYAHGKQQEFEHV